MRFSILTTLVAATGLAAAFPADVPVVSPEELDTGVVDASACYVVAYHLTSCMGNVGAILGEMISDFLADRSAHLPSSLRTSTDQMINKKGVAKPPSSTCVGVGPTAGSKRLSYSISAACPILNVFLYRANGCDGSTPVDSLSQAPGCYDIVANTNINSIRFKYAQ